MSAGEIAGLIAACAFVLLVGVLAVPLFKLGAVLEETQKLVADISRQTVPLLGEVTTSVTHVNTELTRVDSITANVQSISGNVSALTSLFAATLGGPVIKVAAFSYGVRRALQDRRRGEVEKRVKQEMKAERGRRRAG
jgi:hypothetical protein